MDTNQQDQSQQSQRGRGSSFRRGRSQSRTRGGGRNYASRTLQQQAEQQQQQIVNTLQSNQQRAQQASDRPKPEVSKYIEQGKAFVSKFLKGFQQDKRGNIEITLDDTVPERISEPYYDRLNHLLYETYSNEVNNRDTIIRRGIKKFCAGITLAVAIKLYKSSTELEKAANFHLNVLHRAKINVPEKAAVIIDQLGKTDLKDDNRIRILNQHLACKRMVVKALCRSMDSAEMGSFCDQMAQINGLTVDHLYGHVFGENFHKMIDNSLKSLSLLKEISKEHFKLQQQRNFTLSVNSVTRQGNQIAANVNFQIKLPEFDFENCTRAKVIEYLNNPIFSLAAGRHFDWGQQEQQLVVNVICAIVCQIATTQWIRNPGRNMGDIDNGFNDTILQDVTFLQIMNNMGVWNINNFILDNDLNDLTADFLHKWNSNDSIMFKRAIKMKEMEFTEFGTDSQMVEVSNSAVNQTQYLGVSRCNLIRKPKSQVALKISETGAIFGIMGKFNRSLRMTSDFVINHDSTNRNILREFLKTDILD